MAAPYVRLTLADNSAALDLTAQTCAGGTWSELQGQTGADWWYWQNKDFNARSKKEGGQQLFPATFNDTAPAATLSNNVYASVGWLAADEIDGEYQSPQSGAVIVNLLPSQINAGLRWSSIAAPYGSQRRFTFAGKADNGTWVATASLSGGAVVPKSLTLATNRGFTVDYHGSAPGTMLTVEIRRTAGAADGGYLFAQAAYISVPTAAPVPRAAGRLARYNTLSGGVT